MGMYGYYFTIDNKLVQQLSNGEMTLEHLKIGDYPGLDIDRSWEAIHYLFCEDIADGEPPFGYIVPLTTEQGIDYGSFGAFFLYEEQVVEAYQAMTKLDEADLRLRYNFQLMVKEEVYPLAPDVVSDEDEEDFFDYLLQHFNKIKQFYSQAVAEKKGLVFYIF
ncbi:YfbM family protein [Paenibacillus yanchengensis]|uniref:YfbM family protein n=1 Tax=Paenibacillus yanchengensis TaxID=2035833 RepID=A0ABW4YF45_9BACL